MIDDSGMVWTGRAVVRKAKNGKDYFYDLDRIREAGYQDVSELNPVSSLSASPISNTTIAQNENGVNNSIRETGITMLPINVNKIQKSTDTVLSGSKAKAENRGTDISANFNTILPQDKDGINAYSMQKPENNTQKSSGDDFETLMEKARLRVRNPQQIANLPKEAASTTPALRQTPNRFAEGKESKFYESLQNQSLFDDEATQNFADTTDLKYYQGITNEKVFSGIFATAYRPNESRGNRRNCWRDFG